MPSSGTADLGLSFGRIPHRSSVCLTPGNSVQFSFRSGDTWKIVSVALAISAALSAWANAVSLAGLKSEG